MTKTQTRNRAGGFTLIELMIVVAVIAILASIALPAYQDSIRKGRRGQAKADLVELIQMAERHRTVQGTYAGFSPSFTQSPRTGGTVAYRIEPVGTTTATSYELQAVPQGAQVKDTRCGTLGLTSRGEKKESGTGSVADCW